MQDHRQQILVVSRNRDTGVWRRFLPAASRIFVRWEGQKILDLVFHEMVDLVLIDEEVVDDEHLIDIVTLVLAHASAIPIYILLRRRSKLDDAQRFLELTLAGVGGAITPKMLTQSLHDHFLRNTTYPISKPESDSTEIVRRYINGIWTSRPFPKNTRDACVQLGIPLLMLESALHAHQLGTPQLVFRTMRFWKVQALKSSGYTYPEIALVIGSGSAESIRKIVDRNSILTEKNRLEFQRLDTFFRSGGVLPRRKAAARM